MNTALIGTGDTFTVIGAGSWGTALAMQLAKKRSMVRLWGRDSSAVRQMRQTRCNARYLPDAEFPPDLEPEPDWSRALADVRHVLVSVPSHAFRAVLADIATTLKAQGREQQSIDLCWATKGLEMSSGLLPHQVVEQELPRCAHYAVLSGPTFAREVGAGLPTAITVAASDDAFARALAERLSSPPFRAYTSADMVGVEVGGAVKNVLAIGAGLSDGLGYGANARVALINRGLREMSRFGVAMGASAETFMGLAGMGDLVLTCTDNQSRNRRMGLLLAEGRSIKAAAAEIGQVVEGVQAAKAVHEQARRLGVDMPIVAHIYRVLFDGLAPEDAVKDLLSRGLRAEDG